MCLNLLNFLSRESIVFKVKNKLLFNVNVIFGVFFLFLGNCLSAQEIETISSKNTIDIDQTYIQSFYEKLTLRFYLSRKFTNVRLIDLDEKVHLDYEPNSTLNLGVGATYRCFTLNLAYGFGFLNYDEGKGKTRYLDLQTHLYKRKFALDVFAQFYRGFFLENTYDINPTFESYYLRPDVRISLVGGSYFKVFNSEKFSYAASMLQNEYQKKSAGSFLLGGKAVALSTNSDSAFVPNWLDSSSFSAFRGVNHLSSLQVGPAVGYAHTFVMWQHFFVTLSLELNLTVGPTDYRNSEGQRIQQWQLNPAADIRLALGYNSEETFVGISFLEDQTTSKSMDETIQTTFGIGNVRFNYVKRFDLSNKWTND